MAAQGAVPARTSARGLLAFASIALVFVCCAFGVKATPVSLRVGAIYPLTGPNQFIAGIPSRSGFLAAMNKYKNSIPGVTLEFNFTNTNVPLILDDVSTPIRGLVNAMNFVVTQGVVGIIGAWNSAVSIQINGIATHFGTCEVSTGSSSPRLSVKSDFPTFLRTVPSDEAQYRLLTYLIANQGWTKVAIVYSDDAFGEGGAVAFKEAAPAQGIDVLAFVSVAYNSRKDNKTMTFQVQRIIDSGARVIIVSMATGDAQQFLETAEAFGIAGRSDYVFVGADGWVIDDIVTDWPGHENTLRGVFGTAAAVVRGTPEYAEFVAALVAAGEPSTEPINQFAAYAYDGTKMFIGALNRTVARLAQMSLSPECLSNLYFSANTGSCQLSTAVRDSLYNNATCNGVPSPCNEKKGVKYFMEYLGPKEGQYGIHALNPAAILLSELYDTDFFGPTGPLTIDKNGDRFGLFSIMNGQTVKQPDNSYKVVFKPIGTIAKSAAATRANITFTEAIVYSGGTNEAPNTVKPVDYIAPTQSVLVLSSGSKSSTGIIAGVVTGAVVLCIAIAVVAVRMRIRKQREIDAANAWTLKYEDVEFKEVLGRGSFGIVRRAIWRGTVVAAKELLLVRSAEEKAAADKEVEMNTVAVIATARRQNGQLPGQQPPAVTEGEAFSMGSGATKDESTPSASGGSSGRRMSRRISVGARLRKSHNTSGRTRSGGDPVQEIKAEAKIMAGLRHPNIVLFMGACFEEPHCFFICEYMSRGSLKDVYQTKNFVIDAKLRASIALDSARGMQFLHSSGLIHQDLKSPNILLNSQYNAKIADFGLAQMTVKKNKTNVQFGSLLWMAPERLRGEQGATEAADVYAFGIVLWEILNQRIPYASELSSGVVVSGLVVMIALSDLRPVIDPTFPAEPEYLELMQRCWSPVPSSRPPFSEIVEVLAKIHAVVCNEPVPSSNGAALRSTLSLPGQPLRKGS